MGSIHKWNLLAVLNNYPFLVTFVPVVVGVTKVTSKWNEENLKKIGKQSKYKEITQTYSNKERIKWKGWHFHNAV
jgi:hypothetical protein